MKINQTIVEVVRGGVQTQSVDAIVNAANTKMQGGSGVDGAIHRAAGKALMAELRQVAPNGAKVGEVVVTGAHALPQKHIFHVAGPVWNDGKSGEADKLAACYRNCLDAAEKRGLESVAFCSISTGIYGYPIANAAPEAVATVTDWLDSHPETSLRRVVFAMFHQPEFDVFTAALAARENS